MNPKHIVANIEVCLVISKLSNCPRRKFGAVLFDPERNTILGTGYNGGPRGGGALCAGHWCARDGLTPEDVTISEGFSPGARDRNPCFYVNVKGEREGKCFPWTSYTINTKQDAEWRDVARSRARAQAETAREQLLQNNPAIQSGTHMESGCHHSEMNAITNAAANGIKTDGAWMIVTGEPCLLCAKLIHHAGIKRVLCVRGGYAGGDKGTVYLEKYGVPVQYVDGPQDPRLS